MNNLTFLKAVFGLSLILFVGSCTTVYFDRPQPKDGEVLDEFPDEILNVWYLNEELGKLSIEIKLNSLNITEYEKDSLTHEMLVTKKTILPLGDSIILKKSKSFYFLNLKENEDKFQVLGLVLNKDNEVDVYTPQNMPFWKNSRRLKLDSVIVKEDGFMSVRTRTQQSFILNEGEDIQSIYYSGKIKSKHLKKMIREENLVLSLKADGNIYFN